MNSKTNSLMTVEKIITIWEETKAAVLPLYLKEEFEELLSTFGITLKSEIK